jgi:Methyl-CpG binding domain
MMAEQLAYWDACALVGNQPEPWEASLERDERFLMVKVECGPDSVRKLGSVPRSSKRSLDLDVNLNWYLVWQVAYVVVCFADGFLKEPLPNELQREHSPFEELCQVVNIDRSLLDFARDRGMNDSVDSGFDICQVATTVEYVEKNPRTGRISRRTNNNKKTKANAKTSNRPKSESKSDVPANVSCKTKPEPTSDPRKKKQPAPVKRRALPSSRPPAKKVWEGAPCELMGPGEIMEHGWPQGWRKEKYERQSGGSKGEFDRYWFTPNNKKLRSLVEVKRYMAALAFHKDDEAAYRARKSSLSHLEI